MTLGSLVPGQVSRVKKLNVSGPLRRRLMDMGLVNGTVVSCAFKSMCGNPVAYNIRGTVIALRLEDGALIDITG